MNRIHSFSKKVYETFWLEKVLKETSYSQEEIFYAEFMEKKNGPIYDEKNKKIAVSYYNLVTSLYEFGWGESFHFAPRYKGESFLESIRRHEYFLSSKIGINEADKVLDAGCGIMGPARNIARFTGADVTGINLNTFQIKRATQKNAISPFPDRLHCMEMDYSKTDFPSESFDKIFSIEAFCHSPDLKATLKEMFRVLKPGGRIGCYEWVLTDLYDDENEDHVRLRSVIEGGSGIVKLHSPSLIKNAFVSSGFDILEFKDLGEEEFAKSHGNNEPWHKCFEPGWGLADFPKTYLGRFITFWMTRAFESLGISPKGFSKMQKVLSDNADAIAKAGEIAIFSPMLFVLATKTIKTTENE